MTGPAWLWWLGMAAAVLWAWVAIGAIAAPLIARLFRHPAQANTPAPGTSPVPGQPSISPDEGTSQEGAARPGAAAPAPAEPHGGDMVTVKIKADGRMETIYHLTGETLIDPGSCAKCQRWDGCHACGVHPVYDPGLHRVIHRFEKCPAHAETEPAP